MLPPLKMYTLGDLDIKNFTAGYTMICDAWFLSKSKFIWIWDGIIFWRLLKLVTFEVHMQCWNTCYKFNSLLWAGWSHILQTYISTYDRILDLLQSLEKKQKIDEAC